ncbi:MAG: helix-turn-helix domain-containing protein [bacterium]|nr:helix-turn-helix domain-containing protein [bacterium]
MEKDETTFGHGCPECGIGTVQPTKIQNFKTRIRGDRFTVSEALIGVCDQCDAHHFSSIETRRWRQMYEDRIKELGSFLSPEEIRVLREKLGLSRDELARLIGCTRQSIRTWEDPGREKVPSRMADLLMKLVGESYKETEVDVISFLLQQASAISEPIQVRRSLSEVDSSLHQTSVGLNRR